MKLHTRAWDKTATNKYEDDGGWRRGGTNTTSTGFIPE